MFIRDPVCCPFANLLFHPIITQSSAMNRRNPGIWPPAPSASSQINGGNAAANPGDPQSFALFSPLHYEPNYAYPLLIWLHGPLDNEAQLRHVMPLVSLRNYTAVAPRGTVSQADSFPQLTSQRYECFGWDQSPDHIECAERRVLRCLEMAQKKYHVAPHRVFLAGLECGGTMALRIGLRNPDLFAGLLSFGGAFPTTDAPLANIELARGLPLFFCTSRLSALYPETQVCEHLRLFHSAGMNVTLRQYPGEDGLTDLMLADMDRWLMEQIAQPRDSATVAEGSLSALES